MVGGLSLAVPAVASLCRPRYDIGSLGIALFLTDFNNFLGRLAPVK